jgi:peptide/nickel transport system substrate-binding protein
MKGHADRPKLWIFLAMLGIIATAAFLVTGCGSQSSSTSTGSTQGNKTAADTLVVGTIELPPHIDVEALNHPMGWVFLRELTDTLLRYKSIPSAATPGLTVSEYTTLEPRLAESYETSADGKTVTFHLKKGVKSAWGNEMTAKDVYFKWDRGLKMNGATAFYASVMALPSIDAVKVIDDYTISFTSTVPNPQVVSIMALSNCTFPYDSAQAAKMAAGDPLAKAYIEKNSPAFGPYYVTEWTPGKQAVLTANPNYFMGVPKIKTIIVKVIPESSSRFAMLKDGTIDVAQELSPNEISSLRNAPGVKTIETQGFWLTHLLMNEKIVPQFANKLVRQAVNYAIDRDKIIKMAYFGMAEPMACVYPSQYPGALETSAFPYTYNIEKAKQLMAQAGYAKGFNVDLYYQAGVGPHETACVIIKEELAKIGINVSLRKTPLGTLETLYTSKKAPFAMIRIYPFAPDPNYDVGLMYDSKGFCNFGNFSSPKIDAMIKQGVSIVDPEKRYAFHKEIQRAILEEAPVGFVVQEGYRVAIRDNIKGWNLDIGESVRFDELSKN